jgi:hypothetical protein
MEPKSDRDKISIQKDGGVWRTVKGRRVFIKNGQRISDALKNNAKETGKGNGETTSIKEQLRANLKTLNKTESVFTVSKSKVTDKYDEAMEIVQSKLNRTNGIVRRRGFGDIQVSARLAKAKAYLKTTAEKTAVLAVPAVIRNGIEISGHDNHKDRGYPTFTFAGKVTVAGKTGIVAVVVKKTTGNFYKVHRVFDTNGKTLEIEKTTD